MKLAWRLAFSAGLWIVVLTGCGFHLIGTQSLPPELSPLYVDVSPPNSNFVWQLKHKIEQLGAQIATDPAAAHAILKVEYPQAQHALLSIDAAGQAREFSVHQKIIFRIYSSDGSILLPETTISDQRDYAFRQDNLLGNDTERQRLMHYMQQTLLQRLIHILIYIPMEQEPYQTSRNHNPESNAPA